MTHLVLVEDNLATQFHIEAVCDLLLSAQPGWRGISATVRTLADARRVLRVLRILPPEQSIAVVDLDLPDSRGTTTIHVLAAAFPEVHLIGHTSDPDALEELRLQGYRAVSKDDPDGLVAEISRLTTAVPHTRSTGIQDAGRSGELTAQVLHDSLRA